MKRRKIKESICCMIETIVRDNLKKDAFLQKIIEDNTEYNYKYLQKLFRIEKGQTIKQFHEKELLDKAKRLLLEDHNSCLAVSIELGFSYDSNFNRWFSTKTKMTPENYKRIHNDNP